MDSVLAVGPDSDPPAGRREFAMAWSRVAHDAREVAGAYQQARVPTEQAYVERSGRRRDRAWVPVWLIGRFQPRHRVFVENMDGRVIGTEMAPALPGVALLTDGRLYLYQLVRGKPMLTVPLQQGAPDEPPPHEAFVALIKKIITPR